MKRATRDRLQSITFMLGLGCPDDEQAGPDELGADTSAIIGGFDVTAGVRHDQGLRAAPTSSSTSTGKPSGAAPRVSAATAACTRPAWATR